MLRFLDLMGPFIHNATLCFREFSMSLIDRAYTWYVNFKPRSMRDFKQLVPFFNAKFFCAEVKFSSTELGHRCQLSGEDLDAYIKRFHDIALDCCDPVEERMLVEFVSKI